MIRFAKAATATMTIKELFISVYIPYFICMFETKVFLSFLGCLLLCSFILGTLSSPRLYTSHREKFYLEAIAINGSTPVVSLYVLHSL